MAEEIINITIDEIVENVNVVVNETIEDVTITIQEISKTSDLINDGEDGVHPFITAANIPTVNDATATVKGIVKLAGDLGGTADAPTVPGLTNKVDKVTGKSLISDTEITRLATVTNFDNSGNVTALANKVDKVTGSRLITSAEATILNNTSGTNTGDQILSGLVPYTGATGNVNLGANNITVNNVFDGFTSIVASGTLVTLTINSTPSYLVTGSGGQTIKMPVATTLPNGTLYTFNNNQSSGAILVNNNSNTLIKSVPSGGNMILELIDNSTAAGSWDAHFQAPSNVSWSTNTFDYAGSITNATWNGVSVADNRIASATTWNAKEDGANKVTTFTGNETSTTKFPVVKAILDYFTASNIKTILGITTLSGSNTGDQDLSGLVVKNTAITGATKTKITYDAKGLVTSGADATTADIADSTNKRYQTDNQQTYNDATSSIQTQLNSKATNTIIVTSGTSFTTPSTITTSTLFIIELIGGGGGGGGAAALTAQSASGGGGGGYVFLKITGLSPSTTYTCAIGAAGSGGAAATNGTAGTSTTLTIGATTYTASGGGAGNTAPGSIGGAGGTGTNGTINISGQAGQSNGVASATVSTGQGGNSPKGWGNGGQSVINGNYGSVGSGYGAGGSGGKNIGFTGGNGTVGIIYCQYFN